MRFSIRSKLILTVGVTLLAIYGGLIGVDAYRSRGVAQQRMQRHLRNQVRATATRLEYALRGVRQTTDQLSDYVAANENVPQEFYWLILRRALERNRNVVAACVAFEPMAGPGDVYQFAPLMEREQLPREDSETFSRYRFGESPYEPRRSERTDYFDANWYRQALLNDKGAWSEPYYDDRGRLVSTFAAPIYRNGQLLGVAAVDVQIEWLRTIIERHQADDEINLLVSRNGRFLHHPREQFVMVQTVNAADETVPWASLARAMASGGEESRRIQTPRGPVWAVFTPIPSSNWSFAAILPEEKMTQPLRRYIKSEVAVLLAGLGLVMLVVLVMSLSLTGRLKRLTRAIRQVQRGNPHARVPGRAGRDEIGDAIRAFHQMTEQFRDKEGTGD
jgi:HAMP domain-containing protein